MDSLHDVLLGLEQELLSASTWRDPARLAELLHDEFVEVGKSGKRWTKSTSIAALLAETDAPTGGMSFSVSPLANDESVVLAEWSMPGARRSSIWVKVAAVGWQLRYHQGTFSNEVPEGDTASINSILLPNGSST
jgi:hypothetical protein